MITAAFATSIIANAASHRIANKNVSNVIAGIGIALFVVAVIALG